MMLITEKDLRQCVYDYMCQKIAYSVNEDLYSKPSDAKSKLYNLVWDLQNSDKVKSLDWYNDTMVIVNNKFILTANGKWRVKGKNKWYLFKNVKQFQENYL